MAYTTINKGSDYFITHLYSGNDTTNNQSVGLTPDLVWVKCRNSAVPSHYIVDKVRGDKKYISSNATTAEQTDSNTFDLVSGGFNLAGGNGWTNLTGRTYASWNWVGGGTGVSNTDGSITSTVSANTISGFSIVKYTGNGLTNQTVGHGLGVAPSLIMYKGIDAVHNWLVYHKSLGATQGIVLNLAGTAVTGTGYFDNTAPTSSVFSVSTTNSNDQNNVSSEDYIAYCFAEKKGFSKFGSYTGNGNADGTFVYTGFKPAMVIIKKSSVSGEDWNIYDNKRNAYNATDKALFADLSAVEATKTGGMDFVSNGIKIRGTDGAFNASGATYIYMCFAEFPIVSSSGVPCTAR